MRKIFAITALCCLVFITTGYHVFFRLRIAEAKEEMRQELLQARESETTKLIFSQDQMKALGWDGPSEFLYNNEMYDVLKIETAGLQTIIWCVSDQKETSLVDSYLKTQKKSSEKNSSNTILKLVAAQFIAPVPSVLTTPDEEVAISFYHYHLLLPRSAKTILIPPPKVC